MISRRRLLPLLGSAAALRSRQLTAHDEPPLGKLRITRFAVHKATLRWRDLLFLEVHTDGGLAGVGEGSLHARADLVEQALRWLEPHMIGLDPAGIEDHWDRMYYRLTRWRSGPVICSALAAVDIALWDLEGKRLGVPVWRLQGAAPGVKARPYFTHWERTVAGNSPEDLGRAAAQTKAQGWTALKFNCAVGRTEQETIDRTVEKLAAVRRHAGEDFDICLELGERFNARTAIRFAHAVAPYHPLFLEEATLRENPEAMTEVAAKSPVPLATGEGLVSRFEFRRLLDCRGATIIQPDVLHCGGITELRRIADFAETYGVEVAPHQCCGPIGHVASATAVAGRRNLLIHEWEAQDDPLYQEITGGVYPVQRDGFIELPDGSGLGISMDFGDFCRRFPHKSGPRQMPGLK